MAYTYHRIDKSSIERIEGSVNMKAIKDFKESIEVIIEQMVTEGWDIEDARDYLFQEVENEVDKQIEQSENEG